MQETSQKNFKWLSSKLKHGSQAAIARRFGVTGQYVNMILAGTKQNPSILKAHAKKALKDQQEKERDNVELHEILQQIIDKN